MHAFITSNKMLGSAMGASTHALIVTAGVAEEGKGRRKAGREAMGEKREGGEITTTTTNTPITIGTIFA